VGIAGSDDKCEWLMNELKFDAVINYKKAKSLYQEIKRTCPHGVDIYFDNVGGEMLNTVMMSINMHARIVICGAISQYTTSKPPPLTNHLQLLVKRARMEGFVVFDYAKKYPEAVVQLTEWIKSGKLNHKEYVVDGLENAPNALNMLWDGRNEGKLLIRVAKGSTQSKL